MRLDRLLERAAAARPLHIAIEDPATGRTITYQELEKAAGELAWALREAGVQPGDRVGVYSPKSIDAVSAIFGILKAGGAYVPVDPTAPPSRAAYIYSDCSVRAIIAERSLTRALVEQFGDGGADIREIGSHGTSMTVLTGPVREVQPAPADLAYILYTSGSTGMPKGVMISQENALSFVDWCSDTFQPNQEDRFSSHSPFHFDLSIHDIFVSIKHAATLVLIREDLGKQPAALAELISGRRITIWYSAPSILRLLVQFGKLGQYDFSALRIVHFAGEVFPVKYLRELQHFWPHPRYFNLYGPTETNVCTYYEIPGQVPAGRSEPYPIGKVCTHVEGMVLNEQNEPVPPGAEGELLISGASVMLGYWNLPEQSEKAFFIDSEGVRWYRTGDVVKEQSGEGYLYLGRRDRMVKRRSYRVELGEIEAALYKHPYIQEAAVISLPEEESGVLIKAFLSCTGGKRISQIELKTFCSANLPKYMIPDRFSIQPVLPKTSTDKIDYQLLKDMD